MSVLWLSTVQLATRFRRTRSGPVCLHTGRPGAIVSERAEAETIAVAFVLPVRLELAERMTRHA